MSAHEGTPEVIPTKYGLSALIYRRTMTLDPPEDFGRDLDEIIRQREEQAMLVRRGDIEMTQAQWTLFDNWVAGGSKSG